MSHLIDLYMSGEVIFTMHKGELRVFRVDDKGLTELDKFGVFAAKNKAADEAEFLKLVGELPPIVRSTVPRNEKDVP